MSGHMPQGPGLLIVFSGLLLAVAQAGAESDPAPFKCVNRSGTTYSQVQCPGGKPLAAGPVRHTSRSAPVPQDRAVIARRATLSPEDRQECKRLDVVLREQQAQLKGKGDMATLDDEMPLVQSLKKFRELHC